MGVRKRRVRHFTGFGNGVPSSGDSGPGAAEVTGVERGEGNGPSGSFCVSCEGRHPKRELQGRRTLNGQKEETKEVQRRVYSTIIVPAGTVGHTLVTGRLGRYYTFTQYWTRRLCHR